MKVTPKTVESVLLGLFSQFRIRAGGRLDPADLEAQWPATHLRATDLDLGVRALVRCGALRWVDDENDDDGPKLELTPSGDRRRQQQLAVNRAAVRLWWEGLRQALPGGRSTAELPMRRHTDPRPDVA